jgi:hypothetical protein
MTAELLLDNLDVSPVSTAGTILEDPPTETIPAVIPGPNAETCLGGAPFPNPCSGSIVDVLILATKTVLLFDALASTGMDSGLVEEILLTRTSLFVPSRPSASGIT